MEIVFVTGATGLVGTHLLREMVKSERFAVIWALYRTSIPFNEKKIRWIQGDMDHLPKFSPKDGITKVIHCAALMDGSYAPGMIYQCNVRWTKNVLSLCKKCDAKEFVLFSSVNVNMRYCGAYAKSKKKSEEIALRSGIPVKIIRPALIFGNGKNGITKLMNYIGHISVIPVFGNGHSKEQPIFIGDLAEISIKYMLDEQAEPQIELYGREPMEYDTMIQKIAAVQGKAIHIIHLPFVLFYYIFSFLEHFNLRLPLSAEQIAHIYEDLAGEMVGIYRRYHVSPKCFSDYLKVIIQQIGEE